MARRRKPRMRTYVTFGLCLVGCAGVAAAQTKISGTGKCGKPEAQHAVEVGDRPGHMLVVVKQSCTWTTPIEMEGVKAKSYTAAITSDATGQKAQDHGYVVVTMENGDKAFVRINAGTSMMGKNGQPESDEGTWSYTGGTGKFKGLKGKGTYKGKMEADGFVDMIEGEYTLAAATAKK
jgi:hypothetical protein